LSILTVKLLVLQSEAEGLLLNSKRYQTQNLTGVSSSCRARQWSFRGRF